jgi:hypothetical protein
MWDMDGRQVRHLASGALLAGSLVSGGTVGNVLLLGSAEHRGDPVGRLGAQLVAVPLAAPARGAGAAVTHPIVSARGSRAAVWVVVPARVTAKRSAAAPPPVVPVRTPPVKSSGATASKPSTGARVVSSQGSRAAAPPLDTRRAGNASGSAEKATRPAESTPKAETSEGRETPEAPEKPEKPEDHRDHRTPELDD